MNQTINYRANLHFIKSFLCRKYLIAVFLMVILIGCTKLVEVDAPSTSINGENLYTEDATAISALTGIYARINSQSYLSALSMTVLPGLSSDELTFLNGGSNFVYQAYYNNTLTSITDPSDIWHTIYPTIYSANSALEGLTKSQTLTPGVKQQLLGEAKLIRAFCYFYLVNYYGEVPIVLTTDYKVNAIIPRASKESVYQQIVSDLTDASNLLSSDFLGSGLTVTSERTRPSRWAALALLARVNLYVGKYHEADELATQVINASALFHLESLNNVFQKNSFEAIWQIQPIGTGMDANTAEGKFFILPDTGPNTYDQMVYLNKNLLNVFETGDLRKIDWIHSVEVNGQTYFYPYKYKVGAVNTTTSEYSMVLRLGEQYLIRAEARAQQGNIAASLDDLNIIRNRAGLDNYAGPSDKSSLLKAVFHERQIELFVEWGHRWLDIKRTGEIDNVMPNVCLSKGGIWEPYKALYPISQDEIKKNPSLKGHQNPGYSE